MTGSSSTSNGDGGDEIPKNSFRDAMGAWGKRDQKAEGRNFLNTRRNSTPTPPLNIRKTFRRSSDHTFGSAPSPGLNRRAVSESVMPEDSVEGTMPLEDDEYPSRILVDDIADALGGPL